MSTNIFKIYDGRTHFWQWDTHQKLIVLDDRVTEVRFENKNMNHSRVKPVYVDLDGLRVCDVPDILLQLPKQLIAYACIEDDASYSGVIKSVRFAVLPQKIPSDYICEQEMSIQEQVIDLLKHNQADWNQNDETAADYIKNRTHYEDEPLTISWDTENREQPDLDYITSPLYLVETDEAKLEIIKNCTWAKCGRNNQEAVYILNKYNHDNYIIFSVVEEADITDAWKVRALLTLKDNVSVPYQVGIYPTKGLYLQWDREYNEFISPFICDTIHKLDPKFIPWPDENDALELVAELGVVEPVAAADGSIYTDKNGLIFSL